MRVPFAENSVYEVPEGSDDEAPVMLSRHAADRLRDRRPVRRGQAGRRRRRRRRRPSRTRGGDDRRSSTAPSTRHRDRPRRRPAGARQGLRSYGHRQLGRRGLEGQVLALTDGARGRCRDRGCRHPGDFTMAVEIVRPGGHVANVGVHGKPVELALPGAVDLEHHDRRWGSSTPTRAAMLLKLVAQHSCRSTSSSPTSSPSISSMEAYEVFGNAGGARRAEGAHPLIADGRSADRGRDDPCESLADEVIGAAHPMHRDSAHPRDDPQHALGVELVEIRRRPLRSEP